MDKYEYKLKAEEIRTLAANKQYIEAMQIADAIDWRRVKSVMMLNVVSEIYKMNRRYEDSKEILLLAYERHPGGRSILYSLCELAIKMEEFVQAVEYYKEFVQSAPRDMGRYILQYKLYEAQEVSLEERIAVLEEFKRRDYREKWAYELAFLYHRIGLSTRCVEECDELILWFGEGKYVTKGMELKMLHEPLTPAQMEKYQKKKRKTPLAEMSIEENYAVEDEMDIQVKTVDVGQYNTINLQQELAASMQEFMSGEIGAVEEADPIAEAVIAPLLEETAEIHPFSRPIQRDSQEVFFEDDGNLYEQEEVSEAGVEEVYAEEIYSEEDYVQGDTQVIYSEELYSEESYSEEPYAEEAYTEEAYAEETYTEEPYTEESYTEGSYAEESYTEEPYTEEAYAEEAYAEETYTEEIYQEEVGASEEPALNRILSQEYDGQITLVVPEAEQIEKQITGQMSIEDILFEWEKMKKDSEEKRKEELRKRVLEQTSDLFYEFDASAKADIMDDLNRLAEKAIEKEDELSEAEHLAEAVVEEMEEENAEAEGEEYYEEVEPEAEGEEYYEEVEPEAEGEEYYEEVEPEIEGEEYYEEVEPEIEGEEYYEEVEAEGEEYYEEVEPEAEGEEYYEEVEPEAEGEEYYEEVEPEAEGEEYYEEVEPEVERRNLSKEQETLFGSFIASEKNRVQIVDALDQITLAPYTGNIIITGDMGTGTLTLAKNMVKEVQNTDRNFSGKVAKITGESLNKRNVADTIARLKNGALLVEKAGSMTTKTLEALEKALEQENSGIIVALEDTKKEMDKLLERNVNIQNKFNARVDIAELNNDALVAHGKEYAMDLEYAIDELGVLALYTRIAEMQTSEHVVNVREVEELIDDAIRHANRKNLTHFSDILFGKRYDEEDMILLRERDFISY